jgi:hypothetical protein
MKLAQNSYNRIEKTLQWEDIKKENSLYNHIYKFLSNANKAGYGYTDVDTNKNSNEISLIFGNYKDNNEYYRIKLSNIVYKNGTEGSSKGIIKSDTNLEKLIGYNETNGKYDKIEILSREKETKATPRQYSKLFMREYNLNKEANLPKIRNYDLNKVLLYSFAAAYGATAVSALDNTPLVNNTYYGLLHLGVLLAPFIPLQFSKKMRSLPQLFSLALVSWVANSLAYYPIGMLMGHTADNLTDMINFYKFQVGLGNGSYIDKYGPIALKISSKTKALSYIGRLGLAGVLSQFDKILDKFKSGEKEVKNGK